MLIVRIGRGRLFDRHFQVLLDAVCGALLCVVALPAIASLIGTNMAITDFGYGAWGELGDGPSAAATADTWVAFLAVLFVNELQIAFRSAGRLVHDQDRII